MKSVLLSLATVALLTAPALAEPVRVASTLPVDEAVTRLTTAVEQAGAKVFLVMDFAKGGASVGEILRPTTLVLFGNPKIGAKALSDAQEMALFVPLRLLTYEDADGNTWIAYPDPADAAVEHGLPADHPAIARMQAALAKMARVASGQDD